MLSDTRVVSDLIVGSSPYGRKSVDTTTMIENSSELHAFVNYNNNNNNARSS